MPRIATLALDGETIDLMSIKISASLDIEEKDQSGQTSSTSASEQGIKSKTLEVTGVVLTREIEKLTRLIALAEAKDGVSMKKYRVVCPLAKAYNIREVTFAGPVKTAPFEGRMAFNVSFTLKEKLSVAEKKESRASKNGTSGTTPTKKQSPTGEEDLSEPAEELSWFETQLEKVNDVIGPSE